MTQYQCQVMPVMEIGPEGFKPAPKVDSAIVRLIPHAHIANPVKEISALNTVCLAAFNQRRKTIRNSFKKLISVKQLESLNIDANLRPENLTLDEYILLANFIVDNPPEVAPVKEKRRMSKNREAQEANNNSIEDSASNAE